VNLLNNGKQPIIKAMLMSLSGRGGIVLTTVRAQAYSFIWTE
jgi:hypothetical protein